MTLHKITMAIYASFITNLYGLRLILARSSEEKKKLRTEFSLKLLTKLGLEVKVLNPEKIPKSGQFLLICNHRSAIDPLIIEIALQNSTLFGHWISKKELYNSLFFGLFVRNAGTILLDRTNSQMSGFFAEIKSVLSKGDSIYIFPEGTRNKSNEAIAAFKDGSGLISVKNRLDILPIYIKTNADKALTETLRDAKSTRVIEVQIGELMSYKEREKSLQERYCQEFQIPHNREDS